ncbi:phosphonate metabolism transcriptional regulator PhnF [Halobacillus massiliensis]|uniref:phosphonate metabolism transcriptional regulator PhnF n=1 Tax=Halobacillus massiliensis TaxID=1926286 RepID=UPI0009E3C73C|nr:phosphonate metabolism transcriptional regulator PhnF [Halobacillus massiliensis]
MIDKKSPLPMYYQIEENIKQRISNGDYQPSDMIPSERELSDTYKVSRMTVRQAINNMVNKGILFREKGKGTFVSAKKIEQPLKGLTSFTEDMQARGMKPSSKLVSFNKIGASAELARKFEREEGELVFQIKRIRYADGKTMAIENSYIPVELLPDLTEQVVSGSIYDYVEKTLKQSIGKASQFIEASIAEDSQSAMLQIPPDSAILNIERNTFLADGTPFEVVNSSYRADRYKFISDIYRV